MKPSVCAVAFCAALTIASNARAAETLYIKVGASVALHEADQAACLDKAKNAPVRDDYQLPPGMNPVTGRSDGSLAAGVGTVAATMLVTQLAANKAHKIAFDRCMLRAGYVAPRLASNEIRAYGKMTDVQKRSWLESFLNSARAVEVTQRLTPALPTLEGGSTFRVIPDSIVLADKPKNIGETFVSARAAVRTAQLKHAISYSGGKVTVPAGATLIYTHVFASDFGALEPAWCASAQIAGTKVQDQALCLADSNDGYRVFLLKARGGSFSPGLGGAPEPRLLTEPVELTVQPGGGLADVVYTLVHPPIGPDWPRGFATFNGQVFDPGETLYQGLPEGLPSRAPGETDAMVGVQPVRFTPVGDRSSRRYQVRRVNVSPPAN